jgi:hypothetical protein
MNERFIGQKNGFVSAIDDQSLRGAKSRLLFLLTSEIWFGCVDILSG